MRRAPASELALLRRERADVVRRNGRVERSRGVTDRRNVPGRLAVRANDERENRLVSLLVRQVDHRPRRLGGRPGAMILHETDDLEVARAGVGDALSDGILPGPETAREHLVDDRDRRGTGSIRGAKLPSPQQRHAQRREVVRPHPILGDVHVLAGRGNVAGNAQRARVAPHFERDDMREAGVRDARQCRRALLQRPVEKESPRLRIPGGAGVKGRQHDVAVVDSRVHAVQPRPAAEAQPRGDKRDERQPELGDHQHLPP